MADESAALPSGTVTFLFSDIEGSSRLRERRPGATTVALADHNEIFRHAISGSHGSIFKTVGDVFAARLRTRKMR